MNKIYLDIWLEEKSHPWRCAGKLACILMALFSGVLVSGFPFTFWIVMLGVFALSGGRLTLREETGGARELPEMTYLVPRSLTGLKQYELQKNMIKAVLYACITILGYGITVGTTGNVHLDGGMLLLLLLLFCYQIIMFYHYYLYRLMASYQNKTPRYVLDRLEYLSVGIILSGLCYYKFSGCTVMAFLENPLWWLESVVVIILIFLLQCRQIRRYEKQLVIGDYRR